ncbi:MAG: class I SAM-dependent methyltransferase [Lentimicrobiaceae bacterium]|nr:class I SAM-dependent methyltransferase [Lentimicrobiaceae bacterium]MCB9023836.1 class I SAM-dependent methyltransferase [Lentimicrobiaceae bacterium]MCO5266433.1 class I SAM-dependent methyltransferase [Lentimicrobium sp.]
MIKSLSPANWIDYELIDTGNFEKLERFGNQVVTRPEPQAVWDKSLTDAEWQKRSQAIFRKEKNDPEKGKWFLNKGCREQWHIDYKYKSMKLKLRLGLTSFRHIGVFPEQGDNWDFIYDRIKTMKMERPRVLNLFAYTGGASLAACAAGADVSHVDSVKPVITWARENMESSGLDNIRWIVEDALKFVKREVRRGSKYSGIILDPPAYGRGADGEKWVLEENINEMIKLCSELLEPKENFLIMSLYSMGFSSMIGENLIKSAFGNQPNLESGELFLQDNFGKKLPLGTIVRFSNP